MNQEQFALMKWEVQRPLSPLFPTDDALEDYVQRDSWWREWDPVVRGTFKAVRVIARACRHWRFRKRVRAAAILHTRQLSKLVHGHLDPDADAAKMYQAKYQQDYYNGTGMLGTNAIRQWWYRKEHELNIARLADFLRACGYRAWNPKDSVSHALDSAVEARWLERQEYAKQHSENMVNYMYPDAVPPKRRTVTAIINFYNDVDPARAGELLYQSDFWSLDPDGALVQIPYPGPKTEWFAPLHPPWRTLTTRMLRKEGKYYKYEDVELGFGDVYEHEGLWTVIGPVYRKQGRLFTTWYRTNGVETGEVVRLQSQTPEGTLKGTLASKEELDTLFNRIKQ